mmetsp:Transcript_10602/g.27205  ORF Transcript_10602/g.27205 Transcript_10602/m.27205 type:complete len:156 (-) Transcript_10602:413-880(-)
MPSIFDNVDEFEDGRPGFDDQDPKRQKQLIKNVIQMMTATTGVYVMRLSAAELKRLRHDKTNEHDPLKLALTNLDEIFKNCKAKTVDVDTAASVDAILEAHDRDKKSNGTVFLAWEIENRAIPRANPELVGIAVCTKLDTDKSWILYSDTSTQKK